MGAAADAAVILQDNLRVLERKTARSRGDFLSTIEEEDWKRRRRVNIDRLLASNEPQYVALYPSPV